MAEKKFFRYYNGHEELERKDYLIVGTYGSSRIEARETLYKVLYIAQKDDAEPVDKGLVFEYIDERELHEGEEPTQTIFGWTPDQEGRYKDQPTTTINF